jgi:hypothetical protein
MTAQLAKASEVAHDLGAMPTLAWACVQAENMATQAWPWHPKIVM